MKRALCILLSLFLLLTVPIPVLADGDPNIDGGGGNTSDGDLEGGSYWNIGEDGVRITVVREESKQSVTTPVDFSNTNVDNIQIHFGKKNKLQYGNLSLDTSEYVALAPEIPLPQVVSSGGGSNIEAVRNYFKMEGTIKDIADKTGFDYEELINGEYVLLLEPILYFRYQGTKFAATAT